MNRLFFLAATLAGAAAIIWTGLGFLGAHPLALGVTVLIGLAYTLGVGELMNYRRATGSLQAALQRLPAVTEKDPLPRWLERLHPSLRHPVRLRIEGQRVGLPTPVFTPYLLGLLVMLGLLGTFFGMVETLSGAVIALQGNTDLETIRAGLAAPIAGLGVAFGTSVAGVAASAMLGLAATLCRRERSLVTRALDEAARQPCFAPYTPDHHRQQTLDAVQAQSAALPAVVERLDQLVGRLAGMGGELGEALVAGQARFHETTGKQYEVLADRVGVALNQSLADGSRLMAEGLQAPVSALMSDLAGHSERTQAQLTELAEAQQSRLAAQLAEATAAIQASVSEAAQTQLRTSTSAVQDLAQALNRGARELVENHQAELQSLAEAHAGQARELAQARVEQTAELIEARRAQTQELSEAHRAQTQTLGELYRDFIRDLSDSQRVHQAQVVEQVGRLLTTGEELVSARVAAERDWLATYEQRVEALAQTIASRFDELRRGEEERAEAAAGRLATLEATVADQLARLGRELEQPMTRLIETASETPRAAAEVIAQLRAELSRGMERDNALLDERERMLEQLQSLLETVEQATEAQRKAVARMVDDTAYTLQEVSARFGERVDTGVERMADLAGDVAGSATDVASLGEAFQHAVTQFGESSQALIDSLDRIEQAMDQASARSDEQLGYYVAQAREIIDHSVLSQKEIIEHLQQFGRPQAVCETEAS